MTTESDMLESALLAVHDAVGKLRMVEALCENAERPIPGMNFTQARWLELDRQEIEKFQRMYEKARAA